MVSRRQVIVGGLASGAALFTAHNPLIATNAFARADKFVGVETLNGQTLAYRERSGVKIFHLIAEEFTQEFCPGLKLKCWGYNGRTPGPTIEVVEGERVRIYVTNKLSEPTSVHWHGIILPNGMDGVAGLTQAAIRPGKTFKYEFVFQHPGTYMYHPHADEMTQIALGMQGIIVVHPKEESRPVDRDFALMMNTWKVRPGTSRPDPMAMSEFNVLTFNGKCFPGTAPLVVRRGQRVRLRLCNLSPMDHHPIHIHGHRMRVVATDGGEIAEAGRWPETTILVPTGSTRTAEFVAEAEGDWPLHCHMTHHAMNQMGHDSSHILGANLEEVNAKIEKRIPGYMSMGETGMFEMGKMGMPSPKNSVPMIGAPGPFGYIDMGGMFTMLKVREGITSYEDPGWYKQPEGTSAVEVSETELLADLG